MTDEFTQKILQVHCDENVPFTGNRSEFVVFGPDYLENS